MILVACNVGLHLKSAFVRIRMAWLTLMAQRVGRIGLAIKSSGVAFDSRSGRGLCVTTLCKLFTPVTKLYNLKPANRRWRSAAGKVTVGMASHWPCVTDFSGLTAYGLKVYSKRDEHPAYAVQGIWYLLYLYLYICCVLYLKNAWFFFLLTSVI